MNGFCYNFSLCFGGGEERYGNDWIDFELDIPKFSNQEVQKFIDQVYKKNRLSWENVRINFNNLLN